MSRDEPNPFSLDNIASMLEGIGNTLVEIRDRLPAPSTDLSLARRAELAREVYRTTVEQTESLEPGNLGLTLAYLMGAILDGGTVDLDSEFYAAADADLRRIFPSDHAVWAFVERWQRARVVADVPADVAREGSFAEVVGLDVELVGRDLGTANVRVALPGKGAVYYVPREYLRPVVEPPLRRA